MRLWWKVNDYHQPAEGDCWQELQIMCLSHTFSVVGLSFWTGSYICEKKQYKELFMPAFFHLRNIGVCSAMLLLSQKFQKLWQWKGENKILRQMLQNGVQASVTLEWRLMEAWVKWGLNSGFIHYSKMLNIFSIIFMNMYLSIPLNPWMLPHE